MIGKIAYATALGLTYAFIACFQSGCGGIRVCGEVSRVDAVSQTSTMLNSSAGEFWNGLFGKKDGAK